MNLVVAVSGWSPAPWVERLRALLPGRRIDTLETLADRSNVGYALQPFIDGTHCSQGLAVWRSTYTTLS